MTTRIPQPLSPYLTIPPPHSLTLLTGLLGASANWLVIRYLYAALGSSSIGVRNGIDAHEAFTGASGASAGGLGGSEGGSEDVAVVLVTWMRDFEFWKTEARRSVGLDLQRLQQQGRFVFVDGLTHLFLPSSSPTSTPSAAGTSSTSSQSATAATPAVASPSPSRPTNLPQRSPAPTSLPHRGPPIAPRGATPVTPPSQSISLGIQPTTSHSMPKSTVANPNTFRMETPTLESIRDTILGAIASVGAPAPAPPTRSTPASALVSKPRQVVLLLDTPTILLHTTTTNSQAPSNTQTPTTSPHLLNLIHSLRLHPSISSTIISLPADRPYLAASSTLSNHNGKGTQQTPLDIDQAAFTVSMVQQARCVIGCRRLGTGWAGDVSGVVRVTRGGCCYEGGAGDGEEEEEVKEGEWLYFVGGDGGVWVWERGGAKVGR